MASISEFIISVVELIEAQTEEVRRSFFGSANGFLINVVVAALVVVGFVFLLSGLFALLSHFFGAIVAYFGTAMCAFVLAFLCYKVGQWKTR